MDETRRAARAPCLNQKTITAMSSFICNPEHFNSCQAAIERRAIQKKFLPRACKEYAPELSGRGWTLDSIENRARQVFDELRKLSALCVSLQYRHNYEGTLDREIEEQTKYLLQNTKQFKQLTDVELYKALQCLAYQIEKEHVADIRELTQDEVNALNFVDEITHALAAEIINALPEYDKAPWDISL